MRFLSEAFLKFLLLTVNPAFNPPEPSPHFHNILKGKFEKLFPFAKRLSIDLRLFKRSSGFKKYLIDSFTCRNIIKQFLKYLSANYFDLHKGEKFKSQ